MTIIAGFMVMDPGATWDDRNLILIASQGIVRLVLNCALNMVIVENNRTPAPKVSAFLFLVLLSLHICLKVIKVVLLLLMLLERSWAQSRMIHC